MNHLLLTGGTGYLGKHLLEEVAPYFKKVSLLVREKSVDKALDLVLLFPNVEIVCGDITSPTLISTPKDTQELIESVDTILHAAAYYDLAGRRTPCYMQNVVGTQNVLYFASRCKNLKSFHYVSTVAVSGDFRGEFKEDDLDLGQKFDDNYAQTKFDAELAVRRWNGEAKIRIYRPGIIIGHSQSGEIDKEDGPYYFLKVVGDYSSKRGLLNSVGYLPLPIEKKAMFPIIPIDVVASYIAKGVSSELSYEKVRCYHVVGHESPTVGNFIQDSMNCFGLDVDIISLPSTKLNGVLMGGMGIPKELLNYVYNSCIYDKSNLIKDFEPNKNGDYPIYKESFFNAARKKYSSEGVDRQ